MAKLVVNPRSPSPWEIELKPGTNLLGRGFANDFKIDDPSVSGQHCQIIVDLSSVLIKDLGSTNGTFVNRAPVREAALQPGQTVHLGGVEMIFEAEKAGMPRVSEPAVTERAAAPPPAGIRLASTAVRIAPTAAPAAPAPVIEMPPPPAVGAPPPAMPAGVGAATGSHYCKFHPRTPARFHCDKCARFFCELCVTARGQHRTCRHCGSECTPVEVRLTRAAPKKFFALLPGAFVYPFKGSGLFMLIIATVVFAVLELLSMGWMSVLMKIAVLGYLFSYMQNIIHATASEEVEMPSLPGMDDVFGGFFRLATTVCICFGLPIAFLIMRIFFDQEAVGPLIIPTAIAGTLYFPMAFLAVAMKDSALAANPMVVMPAIFKAPVGYLVAATLVTGVLVLRQAGIIVAAGAASSSYSTRDMSQLFTTFGIRAFFSFANVYLLTVSMRILGLLYVANKQKFGWFSR